MRRPPLASLALLVSSVVGVSLLAGVTSGATSAAAAPAVASAADDATVHSATQVVGTAGSGFFALIDGSVYQWGTVVKVAAPHDHWSGIDGSLSLLPGMPGSDAEDQSASGSSDGGVSEIIQLAAGADHVCGLTDDYQVYCAGFNDFGQLGRSTLTADKRAEPIVDPNGVFSGKTIVRLAAGGSSTCALTSDGTIGCWGDDSQGQLGAEPVGAAEGNSAPVFSSVPVRLSNADGSPPAAFADFKPIQIAMGDGVVCALKGSNYGADGTSIGAEHPVSCWGSNVHGQLGSGAVDVTSSETPIDILDPGGALAGVTKLALAAGTVCALTDGSAVVADVAATNISCWGSGVNGLTGQGSTADLDVPTAVLRGDLAEGEFTGIALGTVSACATRESQIVCWGSNDKGSLGNGTVSDSGTVSAGGAVSAGSAVSRVSAVTDTSVVFGAAEITSIAGSGGGTVCATNVDGALGCWGSGSRFELGQGTSTASSAVPVAVLLGGLPLSQTAIVVPVIPVIPVIPVLPGEPIDPVAPDDPATAPGDPATVPVNPEAEPTVVYRDGQLSVSPYAGCGIRSGSVSCWGRALERGETSSTPVLMKGALAGKTIVQVAAAALTSCAIDDTGQLYCWGFWPGANDGWPPVQVVGAPLAGVTALKVVVGGEEGGCVLTSAHLVACWGMQSHLSHAGSETTGERYPVFVDPAGALAGKSVVDVVSGGPNLTCALASDSSVACWGDNRDGGLGNGTPPNPSSSEIHGSAVPVAVDLTALGGSPIARLAGGGGGACALTTTSEIYCWGAGIAAGSPVPVRIPASGLSTIDRITLTRLGICALEVGNLYCWGGQVSGELGVPGVPAAAVEPVAAAALTVAASATSTVAEPTSTVAEPTRVDSGLLAGARVAEVASNGAGATCALTTAGVTTCWGSNLYGALGAGIADRASISSYPEHPVQ